MKPEIKQRWLDALRSGEYTQCKRRLRSMIDQYTSKHSYCCLGVLCEITKDETGGKWQYEFDGKWVGSTFVNGDSHDFSVLPNFVVESLELVDYNPEVVLYGNRTTLSSANDSGLSFKEIADIIEEQL